MAATGPRAPRILVLGTAQPTQLASFARYGLTPTVTSVEQLLMWREHTAGWARPQPFHLKVDTGMGRLGVPMAEVGAALELVRASPGLRLSGLLSHLADADDPTSGRTTRQQLRLEAVLEQLREGERSGLVVHLANSAGGLHHPTTRFDLARLGLGLYGLDPVAGAGETALQPVMSLTAAIVALRDVRAGERIGYGGRWTAPRDSRVAVLPIGYADGLPWRLGGGQTGARQPGPRGLLAGRFVPLVGAVSMDMCFVDVTGLPAKLGDPVVLLGESRPSAVAALANDGDVPPVEAPRISARELADNAGTIVWETLCLLGLRLPRRYLAGGSTVEVRSRFRELVSAL